MGHNHRRAALLTIETDRLARADHVGRRDIVALGQGFPVPAKPESDRVQGIATFDAVSTAAYWLALLRSGSAAMGAVDHLHTTARRAGASDQQGGNDHSAQPGPTGKAI